MGTRAIMGVVFAAASVVGFAGTAAAGEVTGSEKGGPNGDGVTGAKANGNSPCLFSGLEDNDGAGVDPSSGETQNWGHVKQFLRSIGEDVKGANSVEVFGEEDGCNARDFGRK